MVQPPNAASDAAAFRGFEDAVADYVAMLNRLRNELPSLVPNSDAKTITATSDALAAALLRARPKARVGDFFSTDAGRVIKRRMLDVIRTSNLTEALPSVDDEVPTVNMPRVHLRYPAGSEMATMPPSLLQALPKLPPTLEYRIVGRALILRDVHAALVLDYIPDAFPRR